jgi:hypothetical protein
VQGGLGKRADAGVGERAVRAPRLTSGSQRAGRSPAS